MLPECQLFGTSGCHLCELAQDALIDLIERGLWVEVIDISEDMALLEALQHRIPVLRRLDTGAELGWPFDMDQVAHFLS